MEGKTIVLCLMVLFLLGNSTHAGNCEVHIAYGSAACIELSCHIACQNSWGRHAKSSYCVAVSVTQQNCNCLVCD
uniref:Acidic protein n=1 Tax=Triticum urartu TaxID=4572 RepID=A0A8R7U3G2_TRIUA